MHHALTRVRAGRLSALYFLSSLLLLSAVPTAPAAPREEWFRGLDLEHAARADLILVVRLSEVSESKMVFGGKEERTEQQFKFLPLRTIKGVFTREQLLLTTSDLGYFDDLAHMERGQLRLMFLGRSGRGYRNHHHAGSLNLSLPPLKEEGDPLLAAVKVLIAVTQEPDRAKKVALLTEGLREARGPAAIPLLLSLQRRALIAAQTERALNGVTPHLEADSSAVREAAAQTVAALCEADYLEQKELREGSVAALARVLAREGLPLSLRLSSLRGLIAAGKASVAHEAAKHLKLDREIDTVSERSTLLFGIGELGLADQRDAVATVLQQQPLDADTLEAEATVALARLDPERSLKILTARLKKKYEAGLSVATEIQLLGELPAASCVPALLEAFKLDLTESERQAFALVCMRRPEPRLVPALATLLNPRHAQLRAHAVEALRKIDTLPAARALQPHLKEEAELYRKLRVAEFLGKHGIRDGYPYAMEHLSEGHLAEQATAALVAIRDPRTPEVLRDILETSNDTSWNSVAVRALGAFGEKDLAPQFLEMASDFKRPLALPALLALADLGEPKALPRIKEGLASRKDEIVLTAARAARKLIPVSKEKEDGLRDQLAGLLADADASQQVRLAALNTLEALKDPRLEKALTATVRDGALEGSGLMVRAEELLRQRKTKLAMP